MKYFIGYLIEGEAATWHINVVKNISEKFSTWKLHEKLPPHITIFYPFDAEDIKPVVNLLGNWTQNKKVPGNFSLSGFGHFDDKVVFAKAETDQSVKDIVKELQGILKELPKMPEEAFPIWHPHATLANLLSPQEINEIWDYVLTLEKPNFILPFDNVIIFSRFESDGKWVAEESFRFKLSV